MRAASPLKKVSGSQQASSPHLQHRLRLQLRRRTTRTRRKPPLTLLHRQLLLSRKKEKSSLLRQQTRRKQNPKLACSTSRSVCDKVFATDAPRTGLHSAGAPNESRHQRQSHELRQAPRGEAGVLVSNSMTAVLSQLQECLLDLMNLAATNLSVQQLDNDVVDNAANLWVVLVLYRPTELLPQLYKVRSSAVLALDHVFRSWLSLIRRNGCSRCCTAALLLTSASKARPWRVLWSRAQCALLCSHVCVLSSHASGARQLRAFAARFLAEDAAVEHSDVNRTASDGAFLDAAHG